MSTRRMLLGIAVIAAGWSLSQPAPSAPTKLVDDLREARLPRAVAERYAAACLGLATLIEADSRLKTCSQIGEVSSALGTWAGSSEVGGSAAREVVAKHLGQFDHTGDLTSERRSQIVSLYRELGNALGDL